MGCIASAKQSTKNVWNGFLNSPSVKRDSKAGIGGPGSLISLGISVVATPVAAGYGCVRGAFQRDSFEAATQR